MPTYFEHCGFLGFNKKTISSSAFDSDTATFADGKCKSTVDITMDNQSFFDEMAPTVCGPTTEWDSDTKTCVSTVDVTMDNASVCGDGTEFLDGQCLPARCPLGYIPIRHNNDSNFLLQNLYPKKAQWMALELAKEQCERKDLCKGLIIHSDRPYLAIPRAGNDSDWNGTTIFEDNPNGNHKWCVKEAYGNIFSVQ